MLHLIRHGLAASGLDDLDPGLAELGHEQAARTAAALSQLRPTCLVVSPLRRTRETAEPFSKMFELEPYVCKEVAEVFDPSISPEERKAILGPFMAGRWSEQSHELQSWRERVVRTLVELGGGDVVVISHYIAICAAIGAATNDDRVVPVKLANASVTTLAVVDGALYVERTGVTEHLLPEQVTGLVTAMPGGP